MTRPQLEIGTIVGDAWIAAGAIRRLMACAVLGLLGCLSTACDVLPTAEGPKAGSATAIGRYTFETEPSTADRAGAQYLLDTTTGDVWLLTRALDSGSPGPAVLEPVTRQSPSGGRAFMAGVPCEDAYQQYLRGRTKK
jgi:hypothetical protein